MPVHRLDYATSGCLAVALTQAGASDISLQWRKRTVDKAYEAVVDGAVADDEGLIDKALLRVDAVKRSGDPSRVEVVDDDVPGAKLSLSSYKVLARSDTGDGAGPDAPHRAFAPIKSALQGARPPHRRRLALRHGRREPALPPLSRLAFDDPALGERAAWRRRREKHKNGEPPKRAVSDENPKIKIKIIIVTGVNNKSKAPIDSRAAYARQHAPSWIGRARRASRRRGPAACRA